MEENYPLSPPKRTTLSGSKVNSVKATPCEPRIFREEIHKNIKKVWVKKKWARKGDPNLDKKIAKTVEAVIKAGQKWFWTDEWQEKEREADGDIKKGRVKSFTNVEDLIRDLNLVEAI
jgi:hypothetical protein